MKILNIFFKNINSLEGEGRVYFDQGPIADSGVFAITGPNGSGKSSILDVITLGLYGETFRFDKPAAHVMTKQTDECFAQVEFALGEHTYRSTWQAKRSDTSEDAITLLPKMTLTRLNGQELLLAETPNQVRHRIAELTGMDFHKFSKSIVLPQGDFAAFLNALDSERMDILEKIGGANLYADYRQQTEARFNQTQTRLTQLQQDIGSLPLLNREALEAAEQDLEDFKEQVSEIKQQQAQTQQHLAVVQNVADLEDKQQKLQGQRQSLQKKIQEYQDDLQRIANNQQALEFRTEVAFLDTKQALIEQNQATLDSYRKELSMLQTQLGTQDSPLTGPVSEKSLSEQKQAVDALKLSLSELKLELPRQRELAQSIQQQLADNRTRLAEIDVWFQAHQADASLLEDFPDVVRLRKLRTERIELGGKRKSQAGWSKNITGALKKNKSALQSTEEDLSDLKARIEADQQSLHDIAPDKNLEQLQELQQEQQARVADLQELLSLASVTAKLSDHGLLGWLGIKRRTDIAPNIDELQARLDELTQEMSREENIIKVLEQALRNEALIKKMSADRAKLVDGKPCYLCGSTTHPYVLKPPVLTDAKAALVDQRGKIQALKSTIDIASTKLKTAQKFGSQQSAKQQRLQQMHSQWTTLANRLNIMRDGMDIDNLSLQKHLLTQETEELNKVNNLVKQHAQLQRNIAKMTADIASKQAAQERLTKTVRDLEAEWANRPPEFDEIEQRYATCEAEEKALIEKLENQLSKLGEKLPGKGKENALFDRLNSRRQDYQVYLLRQEGLQKEMAALTRQLEECENKIAHYQAQISSNTESLGQQEQLSLQIAIIEKQKLIVDQEQQLRVSQIEYKTIAQTLSDKMAGTAFTTVDEIRDLMHLIAREADIRQQLDSDTSKLAEIERQKQELAALLDNELAAVLANKLSEPEIRQVLKQLTQQLDIAEQEVQTLENKLAKQQQYREKHQTLHEQLAAEQQLFSQAQAELKTINDDPAGFRRQIQQLMTDKLLAQTNLILEKLSGRYYVRSGSSEHGLALEIEDTKQKNVHRSPQTLSGGESFVVSLALALALAEIANNGKAIDSLFLDEGFGNLDAESLYLAMSTLENLKTHGKTVGVISHVEGVKKRIKTQIELVKKPNGLSELKLVA
ncbi:SbcC/MukB-like Walker B domain-containing protein [Methylomonas methanica]|uniref:SMC domain protein n=1 Tax=Methylomonas methanica (strain DSM 25384 / MC09) TaxID=857087 RepID=G0A2C4_METMM|nr:AAA family ATPase [Methylomonas methanica]AEF98936.1 SMC domain protein [Methylomonas methanica MC09]